MKRLLSLGRWAVLFARTACPALTLIAAGWLVIPVHAADADTKAGADTRPAVKVFALKGVYADNPAGPDFDPMFLLTGNLEKPGAFFDLCDKIDLAAKDPGVSHVFLDLSSPTLRLNLAQLAELSGHIHRLRDAHKKTFAWIENANTLHYTIASACDTVLMADLGALDLPSLSLMTLHFRDAMDLLGAKASFVRTGDFKGAVEPFTLPEMSPQLRAHYTEMVASMNDALVAQICADRKLAPAKFRQIQSDRLFAPAAAKEAGLVDAIVPFGSARETVAKLIGQEVKWVEPQKARPKQVSIFELMGKLMGGTPERKATKPSIAVLHLDGQILDGENELPGVMVSGPTVKAINEMSADEGIRAVVVRINSPGGSATASEAIRAALAKLAKAKPVVISMGEMAASGGYWISCLGRPVYAEPGTITGSIGVFSLKLSLGEFLKKIGIKVEHVTLDESAGAMSLDRGWTPAEQERMQSLVQDIYSRFTRLVADSRKMKLEQVSPIAGGRVWSGAQAVKLGLVDHLGGLDEALVALAKEANVDPGYEIIHRPARKNLLELFDLFGGLDGQIKLSLSAPARDWLREAGFNLAVPLNLLKESVSGSPAKMWLLAPTEFVIH